MTYTNVHDLPHVITEALIHDDFQDRPSRAKISVTELIGPPMIRQLRKHYEGQAVCDVSDEVYKLLGSGLHKVLEQSNIIGSMKESWMTVNICGWDVTGMIDCLDRDGWLNDFKVVSAYAFLLGDQKAWEQQLNCYHYLCRQNGYRVTSGLRIVAVIRDWTKYQAQRDPKYPQCPVYVKPVKMWTEEQQLAYLEQRIAIHQHADTLPVQEVPVCTQEERWQSKTQFAVIKVGNKKAARLFDSEQEACDFIAVQDPKHKYYIDERESLPKRCMNYCHFMPFCPFGSCLNGTEGANSEEGM